ncbi:transcriptional repressor DicA [Paraliobacillus sp. PM-2]|uniref:helix-turn-helix domain-containing protein n=1 Tax=Paraliobacillus sp. PM-2 TaxID=1462524 RepID=UPI00061C2694|nr:helix-turn-helix transcriptional regulator [Paraliobacillus sp. PM-2]CQR46011.1 transcriptional repressor DicA [Paraliobacillus sp. PM-2]
MYTIGMRIKQLRKERGDSMAVLGEAIGTDSANISNWENDKRIPGGKFIVALSEYFNITTDWLLKGIHATEIDTRTSFLVDDSHELHTQLTQLQKQDQHFIHAFMDFYINYKVQLNQHETIPQSHFISLPLVKQHLINQNILSTDNIATYLPIPISLAKKGDFLFSNSYKLDHPKEKKDIELAIIKKQTNAMNGQVILATYDNHFIIHKLLKSKDKLVLKAIDSEDIIGHVNEKELRIHGVVTSLYKSILTHHS